MASLTRKLQKLFAGSTFNNGQFGSKQLGTDILSNDPEVLQNLPAYEQGWNDAVISGEELPPLEEFQGLQYKTDYQLQYLLNQGPPEWDSQTEYFIGNIQREVGGTKLYQSITDNNIGNVVTDVVNWLLLGDLTNLKNLQQATEISLGVAKIAPQAVVDAGTDDLDFITSLKLKVVRNSYIIVQDQKPSGTNGGTSIIGNNIRTLNAVVVNTISGASLGSNQITLPAGTYKFNGSCPTYATALGHRCYLYNITAASNSILGTSSYSGLDEATQSYSILNGVITIGVSTIFELRHYLAAGQPNTGLGIASISGLDEVYAQISVEKIG